MVLPCLFNQRYNYRRVTSLRFCEHVIFIASEVFQRLLTWFSKAFLSNLYTKRDILEPLFTTQIGRVLCPLCNM